MHCAATLGTENSLTVVCTVMAEGRLSTLVGVMKGSCCRAMRDEQRPRACCMTCRSRFRTSTVASSSAELDSASISTGASAPPACPEAARPPQQTRVRRMTTTRLSAVSAVSSASAAAAAPVSASSSSSESPSAVPAAPPLEEVSGGPARRLVASPDGHVADAEQLRLQLHVLPGPLQSVCEHTIGLRPCVARRSEFQHGMQTQRQHYHRRVVTLHVRPILIAVIP